MIPYLSWSSCPTGEPEAPGGGWCDGNGPTWHYYGWVGCSDNHEYHGVDRWAGDRRKSFGSCPKGTHPTSGGIDAYYAG